MCFETTIQNCGSGPWAGKMADIVLINGDPLADISSLGNVVMVIQEGRIVVDNR